jgi:FlaG/FlaF family flagellin (archaellin)
MRKLTVTVAVVVASLAFASVAIAAFTQVSNVKLTTTKAGHSTGIVADIHSSSDTPQELKAAKLLVVKLPSGTKFQLSLVKACKLSDQQLMSGKSCPAASKIGSGTAQAKAYPLPQAIIAGVKASAAGPRSIILVVKATQPIPQTLIIRATVSGSKLTIPVPSPTVAGVKVVLTSLKLNVPARVSGGHALITAGRCTAHNFVVGSHFVYDDGSTMDLQSSSPCS